MLGSHGLISKIPFYEESAKTLMLVHQPGVIEKGIVNDDALINTTDLMPTMLDLCGIPIPAGLDGKSFKAQCYGEENDNFQETFSVNADGRMLRFGHYKYVRSRIYDQDYEILFDLEQDPEGDHQRLRASWLRRRFSLCSSTSQRVARRRRP
jgi:choline-sulfatase